jgi:polysaccharide deacetylase 2 family uncharacterized protein YibQ
MSEGDLKLTKKNRTVKNNRKKGGGRKPLVSLLLIVILIVLAFFLLEKLHKPSPEKPVPPPTQAKPEKPHAKPEKPPVKHEHYTTAIKLPPPVKPPVKATEKPLPEILTGTVAIIIDDMGSNLREVQQLTAIGVPLTFSVIPGLGKSTEVAEFAHDHSYDVMIHMPMEPLDYPRRRLEKNGLLMSESDGEIEKQVDDYMREVPYAVGANNHMGSRFTEDQQKMQDVLQILKQKNMFFIDSMTTPKSVGARVAREMGVKTASRNVFLDNVQDVAAIRKQLREVTRVAAKRGSAIAICHPHKATIEALTAELPLLKKEGIRFVSVSKLVR